MMRAAKRSAELAASLRSNAIRRSRARRLIDDGDGAGEARRGALDLEGEARDREPGRRKCVQIGELLDVAVADLHAGAVAFPDDRGIAALGEAARGVEEGRIPAPGIRAGDA